MSLTEGTFFVAGKIAKSGDMKVDAPGCHHRHRRRALRFQKTVIQNSPPSSKRQGSGYAEIRWRRPQGRDHASTHHRRALKAQSRYLSWLLMFQGQAVIGVIDANTADL